MHRDQSRGSGTTNSTTQQLLGPLNHLNSVAQQLLHSLSPPHTKPPPPPPITALADADAALAAAVQLARLHQKKQQRIEALKADVLALEDSWRTVIMKLEEGRRDLEGIISEGDVRLAAIEQAKAGTTAWRRGPVFVKRHSDGRLFFRRCNPLPRAPSICPESQRIYLRAAQLARPLVARPAPSTSIFPAISERGKNAQRTPQR
jgi:Vitamin-D-receptor interacting Mediator subunit 4